MGYVLELLYKNCRLFHTRLQVLEITAEALAKVMFSDLQALIARMNVHG